MATPASTPQPPLPVERLHALVLAACDKTLKGRTNPTYQHEKVKEWSDQIITSLLTSIRETHPQIKWLVTATLMQSAASTTSTGTSTGNSGSSQPSLPAPGRGVFIAQGAWWDNARDGLKTFDLWGEKGYGGVDVTVCVAWITS